MDHKTYNNKVEAAAALAGREIQETDDTFVLGVGEMDLKPGTAFEKDSLSTGPIRFEQRDSEVRMVSREHVATSSQEPNVPGRTNH